MWYWHVGFPFFFCFHMETGFVSTWKRDLFPHPHTNGFCFELLSCKELQLSIALRKLEVLGERFLDFLLKIALYLHKSSPSLNLFRWKMALCLVKFFFTFCRMTAMFFIPVFIIDRRSTVFEIWIHFVNRKCLTH